MLKLVLHPDKRLKELCLPVEPDEFNKPALEKQVAEMIETMYAYAGIGLAANQVGYFNRVIIVAENPNLYPNTKPLVLINPTIVRKSNKKQTMQEGCLSFPGQTNYRRRAKTVRISYQTIDGSVRKWKADLLAAQCIQHELDHLNGKTFLDK